MLKTKGFSFPQCIRLFCTQDGELEGRSEPKLQESGNLVSELSRILSLSAEKTVVDLSTSMSFFAGEDVAVLIQHHSNL